MRDETIRLTNSPVWQRGPVYPGGQVQVKLFTPTLVQTPQFRHGLERHASEQIQVSHPVTVLIFQTSCASVNSILGSHIWEMNLMHFCVCVMGDFLEGIWDSRGNPQEMAGINTDLMLIIIVVTIAFETHPMIEIQISEWYVSYLMFRYSPSWLYKVVISSDKVKCIFSFQIESMSIHQYWSIEISI